MLKRAHIDATQRRGWVIWGDSPYFHLWFVVPFHHLRGEVLQTQGCLQGGPHSVQVWPQCCRLKTSLASNWLNYAVWSNKVDRTPKSHEKHFYGVNVHNIHDRQALKKIHSGIRCLNLPDNTLYSEKAECWSTMLKCPFMRINQTLGQIATFFFFFNIYVLLELLKNAKYGLLALVHISLINAFLIAISQTFYMMIQTGVPTSAF